MIKEQILNTVPTLREVEDAHILAFEVDRDVLHSTIAELAEKCNYKAVIDITLVEYPEDMCGVYHLMNLDEFEMIRVCVRFSKEEEDMWLPTVTDIFTAAKLMENEAHEMFGVEYKDHPEPRHILLADDFVGYPLRKDYESFLRTK